MSEVIDSTVADVMTRDVITITPQTNFKSIVALIEDHRISGMPVVDDGVVIGVVSESDLLQKPERYEGRTVPLSVGVLHRWSAIRKADALFADDLMSSPALTVEPTTKIAAAARLMDKRGVKRLPVVDHEQQLVGIVSRSDLLKVFLRSDQELKDAIIGEVFGRVLWADQHSVDVLVSDGMVVLSGRLARKSEVEVAGALTASLDGVVDVQNELEYDIDDTATDFAFDGGLL